MASDDDWVADVKRWCRTGRLQQALGGADAPLAAGAAPAGPLLGYEAAHPALQALHWPDAPAAEAAR